jgi:lysyl endopeptidase
MFQDKPLPKTRLLHADAALSASAKIVLCYHSPNNTTMKKLLQPTPPAAGFSLRKRSFLFTSAILLATLQLAAQTEQLGQPVSWKGKVAFSKKTIDMPFVDNQAERIAEADRRANSYEKDLRFGLEQTVSIDVMQEAVSQTLPNGDVLRQLTIRSEGAISINLIFSGFELAKGARLYLFDKAKTEFIGAHTSLNNNVNHMMGTELIHADAVVIELIEPAAVAGTSTLVVGTVVHGFLDLEAEIKALNSSGDCEYDVNCPIGAGWENQRNSVAMMMNGGGFCTGSLVNNTSGAIIPYFLSANHCGTSPGGWVFRFRWESPAGLADCATAANSVDGPTTMNVNGGVLRANNAASDFALTELNTAPDPAWGIYYNGWNRTNIPGTSACGIHHPAGDIKKISFENEPLISTTFGSAPADSHWGVTQWDNGVTEGGSSGSPLFDQNHRTVGQLHGGASSCGNPPNALSDEYGKFYTSWTGGGTSATRLSDWLDPNGTGADFIDGVDPAGPSLALDAGLGSPQGVSGTFCSGTITPTVTILNNGTTALTSATVNYGYDGNINQVFTWTGNLAQTQTAVINLPSATLAGGSHTFGANVTAPNNGTDENSGNDIVSSSFTTIVNAETVELSLTLDCYGSEIEWEIQDTTAAATVIYSGGPYDDDDGGTVIAESFCLSPGCYKFVITDDFGDGLTSQGCDVPAGSYSLMNDDNEQVAGLTTAQADFDFINTQLFCVGVAGLEELNAQQQLWVVYPNPASNVLNIEMSAIDGQKTIVVTSPSGQVVSRLESSEGQESLQVAGLAKGVYFVSLSSAKGTTTKTFVVR